MAGSNELIEQCFQGAVRTCYDTLCSNLAGAGDDEEMRCRAKEAYANCIAIAKEARDTALDVPLESRG